MEYGYYEDPDCEKHCVNNSTQCEFKHTVGLAEGDEINFPPTVGDCNDERYLVEIKSQT